MPLRFVQAAYRGSALGGPVLQGETGIGQSVLWELGIHGIPVVNVENACATGATALHLAGVTWLLASTTCAGRGRGQERDAQARC